MTIRADWPRPLALLVELMRDPDGPGEDAVRLARALDEADWMSFVTLATIRHRVAPLVAPALGAMDVPDPVRARIDEAVRKNTFLLMAQMAAASTRRWPPSGWNPSS